MSNFSQRDKLFSYNFEHNNKNIPFKNIVTSKGHENNNGNTMEPQKIDNHTKLQKTAKKVIKKAPVKNSQKKTILKDLITNDIYDFFHNEKTMTPAAPIFVSTLNDFQTKLMKSETATESNSSFQNIDLKKLRKIIQNPENVHQNSNYENKSYNQLVELLTELLNEGDSKSSINLIGHLYHKYEGVQKVKIMKMVAMIFFKQNQIDESLRVLDQAIEYIDRSDIYPKNPEKEAIYIHYGTCLLEKNQISKALKLLNSKVFSHEFINPYYYMLKGDCYVQRGDLRKAKENYNITLDHLLSQERNYSNRLKLFQIINKVFKMYFKKNDLKIAQFYHEIITKLRSYFSKTTDRDLKQVRFIDFIFYILNLTKSYENYSFMNYLLDNLIKNPFWKINKITENDKKILIDFYISFSNFLLNHQSFYKHKRSYIKYLKHALKLVETCKSGKENEKIKLLILYKTGLFHINNKEFKAAQDSLERSLTIYQNTFKEVSPEFLNILLNTGISLYQLGKYKDSVYFFDKIVDLKFKEAQIENMAKFYIKKLNFILDEKKKNKTILEKLLLSKESANKDLDLFLNFSFYYLSIDKEKSDLKWFIEKLYTSNPNNKRILIYTFFNNIFYVYFKKTQSTEMKRILDSLRDIFKTKGRNSKAKKFVKEMSYLYSKIILNLSEKSSENIYQTIEAYVNDNESKHVQMKNLKEFLRTGFFFLINHLSNVLGENQHEKFRAKTLSYCEYLSENEEIDKILMKYISENKAVLAQNKTFINKLNTSFNGEYTKKSKKYKTRRNLTPNIARTVKSKGQRLNIKNRALRKTKKIQMKYIELWNLEEKSSCFCYKQTKNSEVLQLIELFMKQIKNMLFLKMTDKLMDYYQDFISIVKEKNLSLMKYEYMEKLFKFYSKNLTMPFIEKNEFYSVLDEIIDKKLCIHDYQIILLFLEGFADTEFLECLTNYLHYNQPDVARVVFRQLFFEHFEEKYQIIMKNITEKIHKKKFYLIENSPLIHYLEADKIVEIDKKFSFEFFHRFRYYFLQNPKFEGIFDKYLNSLEHTRFQIHFTLYNCLVQLVRRKKDHLSIIREFGHELYNILSFSDFLDYDSDNFLLDILSFLHLVKFENKKEKLALKIVSITVFLGERIPEHLTLMYSYLSSQVGNILFKNDFHQKCQHLKATSLEFYEKSENKDLSDIILKNERSLPYDIYSYFLVLIIKELNFDLVEEFWSKLNDLEIS